MRELFVRDEGQGEVVVLVHGMGGSHRVFDAVIEAGVPKHRFLAMDLPRNGQSGRWAESTPRAIAKGLVELLRELEVERFRLFGHSFGGLVAAELAAEVPERVLSLTLASAPAMGVPVEAGLFLSHPVADFSAVLLAPLVGLRPVLRTYMQWLWGEPSRMPEAHLEHYLAAVQTPGFADALMDASRAMAGYRLPHAALRRGTFPDDGAVGRARSARAEEPGRGAGEVARGGVLGAAEGGPLRARGSAGHGAALDRRLIRESL